MRVLAAVVMLAVAAFSWNAVRAFPDGAPWGAANPAAEQNCATCHFDIDPVRDSAALVIDGLPQRPEPGATYDLRIVFDDPETVSAGFQLFAQVADQQAGTFVSSAANVEFIGSAIRSTKPVRGENSVAWTFAWHAPLDFDAPIVFYIAASAANDDGSPFGDTIHFRSYRLPSE